MGLVGFTGGLRDFMELGKIYSFFFECNVAGEFWVGRGDHHMPYLPLCAILT